MIVSLSDVERVAELANLDLTDSEKTGMLRDLNAVLEYFAELNELDTSSIPALEQVADLGGGQSSQHSIARSLRADEVTPSLDREQAMQAAPDTDGVFFKVPKVIER